jgi:hypothetical protein
MARQSSSARAGARGEGWRVGLAALAADSVVVVAVQVERVWGAPGVGPRPGWGRCRNRPRCRSRRSPGPGTRRGSGIALPGRRRGGRRWCRSGRRWCLGDHQRNAGSWTNLRSRLRHPAAALGLCGGKVSRRLRGLVPELPRAPSGSGHEAVVTGGWASPSGRAGAIAASCKPGRSRPAVPPACHKQRSPAVPSGQSRSLREGRCARRTLLTCGGGEGRNCMACKGSHRDCIARHGVSFARLRCLSCSSRNDAYMTLFPWLRTTMFLWPTASFWLSRPTARCGQGLSAAVARRWPWGAVERDAASVSAMVPGCGRTASHRA